MKYLLPLSLLVASLTGCTGDATTLESERSYRVEWIGERPLLDLSHLTITFAEDGRAHGNAGCNHWFANYRLQGRQLSFDKPGSTRKLCAPALMAQEKRFLDAIAQVQRWDVNSLDQLQLWPATGKPIRLMLD